MPSKYGAFIIIVATILLNIHLSQYVLSIKYCSCNVCGPEEDNCTISDHKDSQCYMSVVRRKDPINGTFTDEHSYGCFSFDEERISHLQCLASKLKHNDPTYIRCCNNGDFCNSEIKEPTKEDDPRWAEEPIVYDYRIRVLAILSFSLFLVVTIIVLIKLAHLLAKSHDDGKEFKGSTYSNLTDIAFFKTAADFKSAPLQACSYSSTHSYLTSEGSYPKQPDIYDASTSIGSGMGERRLEERTVAAALSKGVLDHVGEGRFGRVVVGQYHFEDVAIKCFRRVDEDAFSREEQIFKWLNHDNIVRCLKAQQVNYEWWMFLGYCPHGSLCDFLDRNIIKDPEQALKILFSIINGLSYLHENYAEGDLRYKPAIAHRDLKSKNILMKTPDVCCLADFGHSLFVGQENKLSFGKYGPPRSPLHVGTIRYMSPEILQWNDKLDYYDFYTYAQADLYQFGLVAWEVCNRTNVTKNVLDPLTKEEHPIVIEPADRHQLPYNNVVPHDPSIEDMIKIVCDDNYRPHRKEIWEMNMIMKALSAVMPECWRSNPIARMETLGVKKRLKDLCSSLNPQEGSQDKCHQFYVVKSKGPKSTNSRSAGSKSDFTC